MEGQQDAASQTTGTDNSGNSQQQTQRPTWIEQLPEDMRGDETLYGHKTIGELVKAHKTVMTEREGLIKVPGENATVEEIEAYHTKMGRPPKEAEYSFKPAEWSDDLPSMDSSANLFKPIAHKLGLSQKHFEGVMQGYAELVKAEVTRERQAFAASDKAIKEEWGADYHTNVELAARAFKAAGGAEEFATLKMADGNVLGSHPLFLKVFHAVAKATAEDSLSGMRQSSVGKGLSDEDKAKLRFPNTYKT